ncbi:hypothetical protein PV326_003415, partial [Microctonus aethiopoides]
DPEEYAISKSLRVDANSLAFFNFVTQTHIMEKILPWLTRIKEADLRTLTSGKFYHAHSKIIIGTEKIHLMVVEYQVGKHLILQSEDQFIRQRIEIRTKRYHNQTIFTIKVYSKRTSALFHHTVGRAVQNFIIKQLETSLIHTAEIYIAISNELKIPKLITSKE